MFGKLKEKLKQAVSVFSKKTEEAVVEKVIEKSVEVKRTKVEDKKKEIKETKKEKPAAKKSSKKEQKKKVKPAPEVREEQKETPKEKAEEVITKKAAEEPKEERSFFKKIFGKKEEEEVEEKEAKEEVIEEIKEEKIEEPEERQSFFGKVKTSLTTKKISAEKFEELFWDLELAFLENNVSVEVIEKIKEDLKKELVDKPLPRDVPRKIEETLKQTLTEILSFDKVDLLELAEKKDKPLVIAFFGINGTGKTTSIAKLAHYFQKHKLSVVLAACDTFRAAAIQQLEEHADKLGVKIIKHDYGADAAAVAFDAIKYAEKNRIKVVLLDTAGRLHSNTNLMQELEKILRVAKPDLKIFVGESITGNDCIEQAKQFNDLIEMDGAILTKADVDEKGGAALSISYTIKKPILFLGMGQRYEDLEEFDAEVILKRLGF
ncbi:signal recognition particle-docking protein FtsY [Candidatus Woesearchaeota archaeon]|nr:signal recognition particle-docking protein FtsY [Candidatus Woesearchaeota archaeon]